MNKVRYAVVGLGHIAQAAVLPAFKHATPSNSSTSGSSRPCSYRRARAAP
jgi:predicted dehydrogenase